MKKESEADIAFRAFRKDRVKRYGKMLKDWPLEDQLRVRMLMVQSAASHMWDKPQKNPFTKYLIDD